MLAARAKTNQGTSIQRGFVVTLPPVPSDTACSSGAVAVRKDDVSAAIHAAVANVAGLGSISGGGGLIQTTSG